MIYIVGPADLAAMDVLNLTRSEVSADVIIASNRARTEARFSGTRTSVFKLVEVATFTGQKKDHE